MGNISWNVAGNIVGRTLGPLMQIMVARILLPSDFGVFAIVLAVVAMLEVVRDLGFTPAVIVDHADADYLPLQFTTQLILAFVLYLSVIMLTPMAVDLFSQPELATILPVIGCVVFLMAVSDPVITSLLKSQNYRALSFRQVLMPLVTGVTGLVLAYAGYGVYSLVFGLLAGHVANAIFLGWLYHDQFRLAWQQDVLVRLFSFGRHIIMQRLSGFFVNQADSFFVSMNFGASSLGVYRLGNQLALLLPGLIFPQVQQVLFTEFSSHLDKSSIAELYYRYIRWSGGLLLVYSILTYLLVPYLVYLVLGNHWLAVVPVIQVVVVGTATGYLAALNFETAKPLGLVRQYTVFAILRSLATIAAVIIASAYSLQAVVVTWVCVGLVANAVNEIVFHYYQDLVRLRPEKLVVYLGAWFWAWYVIGNVQL
jgi:O-antigen/teichoic acid export membrane protein